MRRWCLMSRESPRFLTLGEQRVFAASEAIYAVKLKHVFACREMTRRRGRLAIGTAEQAGGRKHFGAYGAPLRCRRTSRFRTPRYEGSAQGVFTSWIALTITSGVCH